MVFFWSDRHAIWNRATSLEAKYALIYFRDYTSEDLCGNIYGNRRLWGIFCWRILHGILHLKAILAQKHINTSAHQTNAQFV
jgi:hypothetical protein